jgi:predicted transcriptional regulator
MKMKQLTKAEEQVMQILWEIKKGFVKDILAKDAKSQTCIQYGLDHR